MLRLCFSHHALLTHTALAGAGELTETVSMATGCSPNTRRAGTWVFFSLDRVALQSASCGSDLREKLWSLSRSLVRVWGSGLTMMSSTFSQSPGSPQVRLTQPIQLYCPEFSAHGFEVWKALFFRCLDTWRYGIWSVFLHWCYCWWVCEAREHRTVPNKRDINSAPQLADSARARSTRFWSEVSFKTTTYQLEINKGAL